MKTRSRIKLLNDIFEEFQQVTQWLPSNISVAHKNIIRATLLIETLEVEDCGQIGGFDIRNPIIKGESGFSLYDRYLTVVRKYHNAKDIKKVCAFSLKDLKSYYLKLSKLRG